MLHPLSESTGAITTPQRAHKNAAGRGCPAIRSDDTNDAREIQPSLTREATILVMAFLLT